MKTGELLRAGALWLVVVILVAAALPLLAIGAWALRAVVVTAAAIALPGGCFLYCVYPRFRGWTNGVIRGASEGAR